VAILRLIEARGDSLAEDRAWLATMPRYTQKIPLWMKLAISARGHIWKANPNQDLQANFGAYLFVSHFSSCKIAVSENSAM
jgi:hypothetical protein